MNQYIKTLEAHLESLRRITERTLKENGGWDYTEEIEALDAVLQRVKDLYE